MFRIFLLVSALIYASVILADPSLDSKTDQAVNIEQKKLRAGQFIWNGNAVPSGPVVALVSIPEQRIYLYRNGILIGLSTVSTGKRGYGTPAGIFAVLEKDRHHRSRTYDNAPMPYANRLTWGGVALHAGHVASRPASHGCIRLPTQFARLLFNVSTLGMTVIIKGYQGQTFRLAYPAVAAPVDSLEYQLINSPDLLPTEEFRWQPENAPEGSVSVILSETEQQLLVYRHGIEIGRAKISMILTEKNPGTHAFIMQEGEGTDSHPLLNHHWTAMGINQDDMLLNAAFFKQLNIPIEFATVLDNLLTPGTTLLITDKPMLRQQQIIRKTSVAQSRCIKGDCVYGQGIQIYADGSKYIGQFKNGLSEGQGQLIFPNGEKYVGEFKNDRFQSN